MVVFDVVKEDKDVVAAVVYRLRDGMVAAYEHEDTDDDTVADRLPGSKNNFCTEPNAKRRESILCGGSIERDSKLPTHLIRPACIADAEFGNG